LGLGYHYQSKWRVRMLLSPITEHWRMNALQRMKWMSKGREILPMNIFVIWKKRK
ncbi:ras GTPase-activating-like protein IQGAP1 X5, partial [Biomphalaria glabrata]